jgi:hypothetical protein
MRDLMGDFFPAEIFWFMGNEFGFLVENGLFMKF